MFAAGFADPVHEAQQAFRAILDAMARPGTVHALPLSEGLDTSIPAEFVGALLTLTDHDTQIWLADCYRSDAALSFVGFHTGAPIVSDGQKAQFALASGDTLPKLDQFNLGTQEYPDRSTTIVLSVPSLEGGPELVLRGPGIEDHWHISPRGLPEDFVSQWASNRELFPRGVDMLLVSEGKVMGLPRTVRIGEGH